MKYHWICCILTGTALLAAQPARANCPFCSAVSQTLRQEMKQMDTVAIALRVEAESESVSTFEIVRVLKGDQLIKPSQQVRINYFGRADQEQRFLVMGIDPPDLLWSSPLAVSAKAIEYIDQVTRLPEEDALARLRFFLQHLDDPDPVLSRDVYDEFASASYADMLHLKDDYDRRLLLEWVKDVDLSPDRRRLYLVMLGICGQQEDADALEEMLRSDDPNQRSGLDALISCYVSLRGAEGLQLINDRYLSNHQSSYADTYAAIMALRFHGTDGGVIDRQPVLESLRLILDRPELADLVIPDLARWEDWTVMDKMAQLFRSADEKSSWVRVPVINYLRACPLPEAAQLLDELKELDPVAFKRATQFFPIPQPASSESSSLRVPSPVRRPVSDHWVVDPNGLPLASSVGVGAVGGLPVARAVNPIATAGVIACACTSMWLAMWLAISGAGRSPGWVEAVLRRLS